MKTYIVVASLCCLAFTATQAEASVPIAPVCHSITDVNNWPPITAWVRFGPNGDGDPQVTIFVPTGLEGMNVSLSVCAVLERVFRYVGCVTDYDANCPFEGILQLSGEAVAIIEELPPDVVQVGPHYPKLWFL